MVAAYGRAFSCFVAWRVYARVKDVFQDAFFLGGLIAAARLITLKVRPHPIREARRGAHHNLPFVAHCTSADTA